MNPPYRNTSALSFLIFWAALSLQGQASGPAAARPVLENKAIESKSPVVPAPQTATQPPAAAPDAPAGQPMPPAPSPRSVSRKGKQTPAPPAPQPTEEKPYTVGSLDILEVKVWNDAKLSGIVDVRPDGMINFSLIGEIKADGLTVMELTQVIKTKLAATVMEDPEVNIQVVRINSKKYYILGGCLRQGEFPLVAATTVLDAFANCGGFKDFANLKKIYVLRGNTQLPFNYKDVSRGRHMEQNIRLQNGDRIVVPE